jgi:hypothetical protein
VERFSVFVLIQEKVVEQLATEVRHFVGPEASEQPRQERMEPESA